MHTIHSRPTPLERSLSGIRMVRYFNALVDLWSSRQRQRRALSRLDAHLLRDIGLNRAEAILESSKPFWRA